MRYKKHTCEYCEQAIEGDEGVRNLRCGTSLHYPSCYNAWRKQIAAGVSNPRMANEGHVDATRLALH
jgi:hypothetical protein